MKNSPYTQRQKNLIDMSIDAGLDVHVERPCFGRTRYTFTNPCGRSVENFGIRQAEHFLECYMQYKELIDLIATTDLDAFKYREV